MMNRFASATAAALVLLVAFPLASKAQTDTESAFLIGPRVTLDVGDISDAYDGTFALGADVRYKTSAVPVDGTAAFDFYFAAEDVTVYTIDVHVTYPFETSGAFAPYVGGGVGFTNVSVDTNTQLGSVDGNDTGLNLLGGAEFETGGAFTPFAQALFTVGDLNRVGISGGILFAL